MLVNKSPKITLTFLTYVLLALTLVEASSHSSGGVSRRDHADVKRFVKKRSPFPQDDAGKDILPVIGAGELPPPPSGTPSSVSSSSTPSSSSSSSSVPASSSSASASASASASPSSSSSSSTTTSETLNLTFHSAEPSTLIVTRSSTAGPAAPTGQDQKQSGAATTTQTKVITSIIAVAASIGGVVILWTIFRKWKLGRSKEFDQRLQPIDWQPTTNDNDGIIPSHRRHSGASSIRRYGAASPASDYGHGGLQPIPDHDFTAGSNLAPVGGYADLSRGPSPQPQMVEHGGNSGYNAGLPLHHQGYGSEDAYGGVRY